MSTAEQIPIPYTPRRDRKSKANGAHQITYDGLDEDEGDLETPAAETECTTNVERALTLARMGLAVFPCHAQAEIDPSDGKIKTAKSPWTPHGFSDASTDPNVIV